GCCSPPRSCWPSPITRAGASGEAETLRAKVDLALSCTSSSFVMTAFATNASAEALYRLNRRMFDMDNYHDINRPDYVNTDRSLRNPSAYRAGSGLWGGLAIIALLALALFIFAGGGSATRDDTAITTTPQPAPQTSPVEVPDTTQPAPAQPSGNG
ncbi:MAG: hypothetical protein VYD64_00175, partial [Pseudomonadota bacterium]|nr:hypothetical protein [Pseudomonadota bacterium]